MTFLGWLSAPFKWLSDLQLGDEKVTLNHLKGNLHYPSTLTVLFGRARELDKKDRESVLNLELESFLNNQVFNGMDGNGDFKQPFPISKDLVKIIIQLSPPTIKELVGFLGVPGLQLMKYAGFATECTVSHLVSLMICFQSAIHSFRSSQLPKIITASEDKTDTVPETNSSPLKMDGWKTKLFFWGPASLQGAMFVSFRECNLCLQVNHL